MEQKKFLPPVENFWTGLLKLYSSCTGEQFSVLKNFSKKREQNLPMLEFNVNQQANIR